ncbi:disintegrin and metalloproteinase domain-containing protein 10-like [Watersipora subatra]|uniref:disintegrin and metalloproteinase domain-containing protein 10-like n=1 Tax=Watersipora subatra TaxID=2589382 RepID=UPI00355C3DEE
MRTRVQIPLQHLCRVMQVLFVQVLSVQVLSVQVLSVQVLSVQVLSVQVLSVQVLSVQVLSVQVLSVQVLSVQVLSVQVVYGMLSAALALITMSLYSSLVTSSVTSAPLDEALLKSDGSSLLDSLFHEHHVLSHYLSSLLTQDKRLTRRSPSHSDAYLRLSFYALKRNFTLHIAPHPEIFSKDMSVETDKQSFKIDRNKAYIGHIADSNGNQLGESHVAGVLLKDGRFEGKIVDSEEEYFIERAEKYFHSINSTDKLLSILYRGSDVKAYSHHERSPTCAFDQLYRSSLKRYGTLRPSLNRSQETEEFLLPMKIAKSVKFYFLKAFHKRSVMYSEEKNRRRRAVDPEKTTCELYLQADHYYYEKWGSVDTVVELLTAYVQAANSIYRTIDFDADGQADNVTFTIKKLKIWTDSTSSGYPFAANLDINNFLEVSTLQSFDSFCLAYTFTHRDFNDGTLGLAWPGSIDGSGGVCSKYRVYGKDVAPKSLNTGIVTTLNFQRDVIFSVSQLTFAHELGHNLGSPHDEETSLECSPGNGGGGNYIMYPKATDGDQLNNNKFSACSIASMNEVMNEHARHNGDGACFTVYSKATCGNKVVESGEDCDCGWDDECEETCCNPQMTTYDPLLYTPCTYTNSSQCSPSEGACCGSDCKPRKASEQFECRTNTSCTEAAICAGTAHCPASQAKTNGSDCADGMVCYAGSHLLAPEKVTTRLDQSHLLAPEKVTTRLDQSYLLAPEKVTTRNKSVKEDCDMLEDLLKFSMFLKDCSTSICQAFGYEHCQCTPLVQDNWNDERLCQLCCMVENSCMPSAEMPNKTKVSIGVTGQPCFEYQGYCDVFLKCRQLDPVGTINSLRRLFSTEEGQATVTEWVTANWYIVAAALLGFVILLALAVKFGAKHEPVIQLGQNKVSSR